MNKMIGSVLVVVLCLPALVVFGQSPAAGKSGEELFKAHCALCHPGGGNIINPRKTLSKKDLTANKITSEADIIRIMRNPGPGMTAFDEKTIPDREAAEIAKYILKTFAK